MRRFNVFAGRYGKVAITIAAMLMTAPLAAFAGDDIHISGGGTGAFDEGEELFGFTTQFAVGATVTDIPVANECDAALDGLGVGDYTVTDGDDFVLAYGQFNCSLMIPDAGFVMIIGDVHQGRVNDDGSITLCGLADIPIDTFTGEQFFDCPFAVTFRADGSGFTYYDVVTGPAGDAETFINGGVLIH